MSTSRDAFLVVYAVMWAAITPSLGRLRVFSAAAFVRGPVGVKARRRLFWGTTIANVGAVLLAAATWTTLPEAPREQGYLGIIFGGLAGLAIVGVPRILHGILASKDRWERNYDEAE